MHIDYDSLKDPNDEAKDVNLLAELYENPIKLPAPRLRWPSEVWPRKRMVAMGVIGPASRELDPEAPIGLAGKPTLIFYDNELTS